jgi:uncharacterized membrane protein YhhN
MSSSCLSSAWMTEPDGLVVLLSSASAFIFWVNVRKPPSIFRTTAKTVATVLLAVLSATRHGPALLSLALTLGATGDAFLAWSEGDTAFLGGLGSFLVAHLLYIRLFLQIGGDTTLLLSETWRVSLAVVMGVVAPFMNVLLMPRVGRKLRVPVAVYSIAIFTMFLSVLTVDNRRVVYGALLFTASDVILASDRFLAPAEAIYRPVMQYAVWTLYYTGQLLIATGLVC